ncbi:hypothetical protein [Cupriavidus metallidurans]|uniref:hypothetical protein n=1 Tax=Cupriavidus metallidurans TaxID=119219 RepID=UPI001D131447|nr:hypothetical protein [Cupriavidus metallidurans]
MQFLAISPLRRLIAWMPHVTKKRFPSAGYGGTLIQEEPEQFDAVEVHGVRSYPDTSDPARTCCVVGDDNPAFFSVYLRHVEGGVMCCADLPTHDTALRYARSVARHHSWPVYDCHTMRTRDNNVAVGDTLVIPDSAFLMPTNMAPVRPDAQFAHLAHPQPGTFMTDRSVPVVTQRRLPLGRLFATRAASDVLQKAGISIFALINRHARHDWGDLRDEDRLKNDEAAATNQRVLSSYQLSKRQKVWIITEGDRSITTVLLPDDY